MKYYKVIRIHMLEAADKQSAMAEADGSNLEWQKAVEIDKSTSWTEEVSRQLKPKKRRGS